MSDQNPNPHDIAQRGSAIYQRKYHAEFESKWRGRFAAIDINTEKAYVADFPESALSDARAASPKGVFFLVRIGSAGAFKTSRLTQNANPRLI